MTHRTLFAFAAVAFLTLAGSAQQQPRQAPQVPQVPLPFQPVRTDLDAAMQGKMFRVQLLLLEIGEKGQHPRLTDFRNWAQAAGPPPQTMFAAADELVSSGAGTVAANNAMLCEHAIPQRASATTDLPATLSYTNKEGKQATVYGSDSISWSVELTARAQEGGPVAVSGRASFRRSPLSSEFTTSVKRSESCEWYGSWSGRAPAVAILQSSVPRESGITGNDRPTERYLLMRIAEAE